MFIIHMFKRLFINCFYAVHEPVDKIGLVLSPFKPLYFAVRGKVKECLKSL